MRLPINVICEIGKKIQNSKNPDLEFEKTFMNDHSIKIFTDGSKILSQNSVGSACICPELNIVKKTAWTLMHPYIQPSA